MAIRFFTTVTFDIWNVPPVWFCCSVKQTDFVKDGFLKIWSVFLSLVSPLLDVKHTALQESFYCQISSIHANLCHKEAEKVTALEILALVAAYFVFPCYYCRFYFFIAAVCVFNNVHVYYPLAKLQLNTHEYEYNLTNWNGIILVAWITLREHWKMFQVNFFFLKIAYKTLQTVSTNTNFYQIFPNKDGANLLCYLFIFVVFKLASPFILTRTG